MDNIRVLRIIEYTGPRELVENQIMRSLHGEQIGAKNEYGKVVIRAATIGNYPEILNECIKESGVKDGQS